MKSFSFVHRRSDIKMCSVIVYLASALVIASSAADQQQQQQQQYQTFPQWTPYRMHIQSYDQPQQRWDQQLQGTGYSDSYNFGQGDGGSIDSGHEQSHDFGGQDLQSHSYPVHQHIHEETPEPVKHYKEIVVPVPKNVEFKINQPILIPVPHPVPIQIPVPKAVVIPIIKEVSIPVEKSVPYPVEKIVHVPRIKEVPFEVVKHVIVTVEKPIPFKVPVHETIIHTKKGSHKIY